MKKANKTKTTRSAGTAKKTSKKKSAQGSKPAPAEAPVEQTGGAEQAPVEAIVEPVTEPDIAPEAIAPVPPPSASKPTRRSAKAAEPEAMSCLDAAAAVLKDKAQPMRCKELIEAMAAAGLWRSNAPTPHATLYSAILREITTKGQASRFTKTDRGHFALNA